MRRRTVPLAVPLLTAGLVLGACSDTSDTSGAGTGGQAAAGAAVEVAHDTGTLTLAGPATRIVTTSDETTELVVALGLQPVGSGSTRVDPLAEDPFASYYIEAGRLGDPAFVGGSELELEAIAALGPDLVVHGFDDEVDERLAGIAPTAVYDVTVPGAWEEALPQLGVATGRQDRAEEVVQGYRDAVRDAGRQLEPVVAAHPRVGVVYPQYRGGADNYLFGEEFALAAVVPELGFELAGSDLAEDAFPGVQQISSEVYSSIEADLLLALGTVPWQETTSAPTLSALTIPVLPVPLEDGQPSAGPLTSPALLDRYLTALRSLG
ncbi:MAG TPA: ABC transporter substrate-binding protein [Geodermatophilus sp.]|nr:ABC transporter substrate-binding protein [Geodermatophilus sp.]